MIGMSSVTLGKMVVPQPMSKREAKRFQPSESLGGNLDRIGFYAVVKRQDGIEFRRLNCGHPYERMVAPPAPDSIE